MKSLKFIDEYGIYDVALNINKYAYGNRIAIEMICVSGDKIEPFATVTVNIPNSNITNSNCNYVDTNNLPTVEQFLTSNGLARKTGKYTTSGYCSYPEYEFNIEKINNLIKGE